ncbi:MAG TPA: transglycosylase domain-containing protein [Acidimicrobiales bacterium]
MRVVARWVATLFLAALGLAAGLLLAARPAKAIFAGARSSNEPAQLQLTELSLRSVVYDREGDVLAALHHDENRSPIPLDEVPPHVVNAILDVEDDSFFQHQGVNLRSILRAAVTNAESGTIRQGGSTVTQQLVKQGLLTPEKNLERKVKEAVYALRLEDQMTKEQILEQYLNTVYFGHGAYGVQAAAETYWGIPASDLNVEQGAFLAAIIRNPVGYDPFNPERSETTKARRDFALQRMVIRGHLTQADADRLRDVPLPAGGPQKPHATRDDYFVDEIKQALLKDPQFKILGSTYNERFNSVFRGGLRIETTFDPRLQEMAQRAVDAQIPKTNDRFVGALASIEPKTGAVRAMVSTLGYDKAKYNLVTGRGGSGRQPGSSFKTFVLVTALEQGIGPNDTISGSEPCRVTGIKGLVPDPYEPENYEGTKGGSGPLHAATAKSLNCAYIRLGLSLDTDPIDSLEKVAEVATRMGIKKHEVDPVVSMSLGTQETTPLEMASAYGVLANDGVRQEPYFVDRVLDRTGKVVYERDPEGKRVLEANIARTATWTLKKVVDGGTGTRARLAGREVAGKTGTSQEWRDAWFVGYTPQLATAVWMGNPNRQDEMRSVGGIRVTGGSYPARTWNAFMTEALRGLPAERFTAPDLDVFGRAEAVKVSKTVGGSTKDTTRRRPRSTTTTPSGATGATVATVATVPSVSSVPTTERQEKKD